MKKKTKMKTKVTPPPQSSYETRFQQALLVADSLSKEVEELRKRGDNLALRLVEKAKNDEISHDIVQTWWEVRV